MRGAFTAAGCDSFLMTAITVTHSQKDNICNKKDILSCVFIPSLETEGSDVVQLRLFVVLIARCCDTCEKFQDATQNVTLQLNWLALFQDTFPYHLQKITQPAVPAPQKVKWHLKKT